MDWVNLFFSYEGRVNRAKFWLAALLLVVVEMIAALVAEWRVFSVVHLVCFVLGIFVGIKRLQDRDKSGWLLLLFYIAPGFLITIGAFVWIVGALIGFDENVGAVILFVGFAIGIWGFVELGCLRGTVGPNQYGPDPLAPPALAPTMAPPPPAPTMAPPPPPPPTTAPPPPPRPQ